MNLLHDPLIRVRLRDGSTVRESAETLPSLLEALGRDAVLGYPGIQKHQEDAFHVFLCLLGGAALARSGLDSPVQERDYWQDILLELAGDAGTTAWDLVSDDPTRPAFMQPPMSHDDWERAVSTRPIRTPDLLDLLPTARNHDLKRMRAIHAHPDAWIFALVSLQTMSGYLSKQYRGICRMNSGFGSRMIAEVIHSQDPGARWRHAVVRLGTHRASVVPGPWGYSPRGMVLVWTSPWDGESSLPLSSLDPFFIEVCRRVRLQADGQRILALVLPSRKQRIACAELKGNVGDAWLPIDVTRDDGPAAVTAPQDGLGVSLLHRLVFSQGIQGTVLHEPLASVAGDVHFSVSVLVGGQGKTAGFHHALVPVPADVRSRLFAPTTAGSWRQRAAGLGRLALEDADRMRRKVLKPAVFGLVQGGADGIRLANDTVDAWWTHVDRRFHQMWKDQYFPWLWSLGDECSAERDLPRWHMILTGAARRAFTIAEETLPHPSGRRYRALATSSSRFERALAREFPVLEETSDDHAGTSGT